MLYPSAYDRVVKVIPVDKKGEYLYGLSVDEGEKIIKAPGDNMLNLADASVYFRGASV
jgi:hypothetical protein